MAKYDHCECCCEPADIETRIQVLGAYGDMYLIPMCDACKAEEPVCDDCGMVCHGGCEES